MTTGYEGFLVERLPHLVEISSPDVQMHLGEGEVSSMNPGGNATCRCGDRKRAIVALRPGIVGLAQEVFDLVVIPDIAIGIAFRPYRQDTSEPEYTMQLSI